MSVQWSIALTNILFPYITFAKAGYNLCCTLNAKVWREQCECNYHTYIPVSAEQTKKHWIVCLDPTMNQFLKILFSKLTLRFRHLQQSH